jgi:hypothetical protein
MPFNGTNVTRSFLNYLLDTSILRHMKTSIITLAITLITAGTMLTGCLKSDKNIENAQNKVQDAENNVAQAKHELNQAINDSIQEFKKAAQDKIILYEKNIAEFKIKLENDKKAGKAKYEKKLTELEQKNSDMKKKLVEYKEEGKEAWESFRTTFSHDMDELGNSISNFFSNEKR